MKKELIKYLKELEGTSITRSSAGGAVGSIIMMDINKNPSSLQEKSDFILYIECAWRIEYKNRIIATSADDIDVTKGLITKSVKCLEGKMIKSIKITPFYDLYINFTDGVSLKIICIFSYTSEYESNWWLNIPSQNLYYEITNCFKIKKEKEF